MVDAFSSLGIIQGLICLADCSECRNLFHLEKKKHKRGFCVFLCCLSGNSRITQAEVNSLKFGSIFSLLFHRADGIDSVAVKHK